MIIYTYHDGPIADNLSTSKNFACIWLLGDYKHTHMHMYAHTHTHACTHTHTHEHAHTCTHTQTHIIITSIAWQEWIRARLYISLLNYSILSYYYDFTRYFAHAQMGLPKDWQSRK